MGVPRFNLKNPAADGPTAINLIYDYARGRRLKMGVGISILPSEWDDASRRPNKACRNRTALSALLSRIEAKAEELVLTSMASGQIIEPWELRAKILQHIGRTKPMSKRSVCDYMEAEINRRSGLNKFSEGTIKRYRVFLGKLRSYGDITFDKVSVNWILDFAAFLQRMGMNDNTIAGIIRTLKGFLTIAEEDGLIKPNQFRSKRIKFTEKSVIKVYLSIDELAAINDAKLTDHLSNARDLFLIAAFTGQRYGDLDQLAKSELISINGREHFKIRQSKTGAIIHIPVHSVVRQVLERNNGFPRLITNQELNRYIKDVAKAAGINEMVQIRESGVVRNVPKWSLVTSHTARRSAATNMYLSGISSRLICAITGHSSEKMLLRYIQADSLESAIAVGRVWG